MSALGSVRSVNRVKSLKSANSIVAEGTYFGCTLPALLEFLGDCGGQDIEEQFLGSCLFRGDIRPGRIQFLDGLVELDQSPVQLQLGHNLVRKRRSDSVC